MFIRRAGNPPSVSQFNEHLHRLQEAATLFSSRNFFLQGPPACSLAVLKGSVRLTTDVYTLRIQGLNLNPVHSTVRVHYLRSPSIFCKGLFITHSISYCSLQHHNILKGVSDAVFIIVNWTLSYRFQSRGTLDPSSFQYWVYDFWI